MQKINEEINFLLSKGILLQYLINQILQKCVIEIHLKSKIRSLDIQIKSYLTQISSEFDR